MVTIYCTSIKVQVNFKKSLLKYREKILTLTGAKGPER